ncbi:MAG: hypothetical protein JWM90_882 [Thermoleophilia bacterium]|nr:hypothetical protein [Thermoleophilia bacterium]
MTHDSQPVGNNLRMDLHNRPIRGIVEVMGEESHQDRSVGLGQALGRLSEAREQRGPVGVLDPFEVVPAEDRRAAMDTPRANRRSGLFRFSERARDSL